MDLASLIPIHHLGIHTSLTSALVGTNCFVLQRSCHFIPSLCRGFMPSLDRLHDLRRYLQRRIDFSVHRFRSGALANLQHLSLLGRQHHRDYLVRAQLSAQGPPGGVHAAVQEALLDGHQADGRPGHRERYASACAFPNGGRWAAPVADSSSPGRLASTRVSKIVKGGVKLDRWGGGKLDQMSV